MIPTSFPEANCYFSTPARFSSDWLNTVPGFRGQTFGGPLDGIDVSIVAWLPEPADQARLLLGLPVFLVCCGALPPHLLTTEFTQLKE